MLRTSLSVLAFATLSLAACNKGSNGSTTASAAANDSSSAASLCESLSSQESLTFNKSACVTIASKHSAPDAGAVKDICGQISVIYSPGHTADFDENTKQACYDTLLRKAQTPVLTVDLASKVCANFPQPDAGISDRSLVDICNDSAKQALGSAPSVGSFISDECRGVRSMFDQVEAVTYCYSQAAEALSK